MKLERYTLDLCDRESLDPEDNCDADLVKDRDGEWVRWEDVEELLGEIDKVKDEIGDLLRRARR